MVTAATITAVIFVLVAVYLIAAYFFYLRFPDRLLLQTFNSAASLSKTNHLNPAFIQVEVPLNIFFWCVCVILYCCRDIEISLYIFIGLYLVCTFLTVAVTGFQKSPASVGPIQYLLQAVNRLLFPLYPRNVRTFHKKNIDKELMMQNESTRENTMLKEIINFGNEMVKDIMTPCADIVDLDFRTPFSEVLQTISANKYSRIPVFSGTKDNIVGILYIKDLLPYLDKAANFHWQTLIRPHICVPETKKIDNLLHEFQSQKIHLAVVIDEYGGVSGVVTLEDIIEEIVGEIHDEFDDDRNPYIKINKSTYIFDARVSVQDFCKVFQVEDSIFEELGEDINTLARLVIEIVGDIPYKHQTIRYKQFVFEILKVDERHISKVKVQQL